ncbi:MAG: hypothetical protein WBF13_05780 [Candidatus Zixiibacteriota bacterium]
MRPRLIITLLVSLVVMVFIVNGCIFDSSKKINNDTNELEIPDLEDEFGGFKPTDEVAGFGDPEILTEFAEDQDVVDLLSTDPQIAADIEDSLVDVYFLRITWGRLEWDTTPTAVTDWSGSAQIDKGTLVLLRKIRFEPGDYIHRPRPDPRTLEWTSFTGPHFDGIYVAIVVPPSETTSAEGTLTFSTTPFSQTFNFSELESINVVHSVDQQGNEIALVGHKKQLIPCGNGFLEGRWIKTAQHKGVFKGRWINRHGGLAGHLKGQWGVRENGEKVFFGKYISHSGAFKGLLRGRWGYSDNQEGGWFAGEWCDQNGQPKGVLKGHFRAGGDKGRKGYFQGQWKKLCP